MKFDYVIVGGGSAGCTLAARLSQDPSTTVCLLEAGGEGRGILVRAPVGALAFLPGRPKINNWAYETVPQPGLNGRKGYQPRGKALGGSSAINAMLYLRGQRQDYDGWADAGCDGWGWDDVLPYFLRSENNERGASKMHGASGPLQVSEQKAPRPVTRAFIEAGTQMQHREVADFNTGDNEGIGAYQVTQFHREDRNGERCSAAAAYLHPVMDRANLFVVTGAHAKRIVMQDGRAVGVDYRARRKHLRVEATREVILSGGAFNSPQLLMLSGIGPRDALAEVGIETKVELPGVGQNLQDHLDFTQAWKTTDRDNYGISLPGLIQTTRHILKWRRDGRSMIASPFAEGAAFLKTDPGLERPDIQLHFVVAIVDDHARKLHLGHGISCHVCVLRPESRGRVFLSSADPLGAPAIDPGFLSDPKDLQVMIKGAKMTRAIMTAPAMQPYLGQELWGGHDNMTDEQWETQIRDRSDTIYHPVGTCKMGVDDMAVVDPGLRVRGVEGLRVVDASVMPRLTSGNTNAPTIMIAEKAADMIRTDAG